MSNQYPIKFANQLRQHLRALRKTRGLTQAQLGELIGVSQARIAEIEANPGLVSFDQLMQLFAMLDVTVILNEETREQESKNIKPQSNSEESMRRQLHDNIKNSANEQIQLQLKNNSVEQIRKQIEQVYKNTGLNELKKIQQEIENNPAEQARKQTEKALKSAGNDELEKIFQLISKTKEGNW